MKGLEKLTSIRLAEALTQRDAIPNEVITDALYAHDRHGESFCEVLIATGHITEWDLAKLVVEQFQVPFLMAGAYDIGEGAKSAVPRQLVFESLTVPLDRFENVLTVVMPILTPVETLARIRAESGCEVFPYVGLVSENKKVLGNLFPEFPDWMKDAEKRREQQRLARGPGAQREQGNGWTSIFEAGDAQVRDGLRRRR